MNYYEAAILLRPTLSDQDVQKLVDETKGMLQKHGATGVVHERVERRALAYPVKKHNEGYYVFIEFAGPATVPASIRSEFLHREELLRLAFVRRPGPEVAKDETAGVSQDESTRSVPREPKEEPGE